MEGCVRPGRVGAFNKPDGYEWVKYLAVGTELALSVVAGLYLGSLVDRWLGLGTPWFTILGLVAGIVSGFTVLVRVLGRGDGTNRDESD